MVTKLKYTISLVGFLLFFGIAAIAQKEVPKAPFPQQLVNDYVGILSPTEINQLERKLVAYNDSTSTQIAIVIENTLEGDDIFNYCQRLAEAWGIGQAGNDNGLLIYVAAQDRKIRLHTGYGMEGFLPDIMAKRIIDNVIVPAFRKGKYYDGFDKTTDIVADLADGEYNADDMEGGGEFPVEAIVFMIIFIVILIIIINNSDSGGGYHRGGRYERDRGGGWVIIGPGGGGWNSGGGGLGGGGFGGFGGGGFGGGGASGGW